MNRKPLALVLDDEPIVQRLAARILEASGAEVRTERDGPAAIEWLAKAERPVDQALIDATLPPDGAAPIIAALRVLDPMPAIIVTSGKPLQPEDQRLLDAVGGVYLPKPFGPQALLDAVAAARRT